MPLPPPSLPHARAPHPPPPAPRESRAASPARGRWLGAGEGGRHRLRREEARSRGPAAGNGRNCRLGAHQRGTGRRRPWVPRGVAGHPRTAPRPYSAGPVTETWRHWNHRLAPVPEQPRPLDGAFGSWPLVLQSKCGCSPCLPGDLMIVASRFVLKQQWHVN